jgi:hypothetical protein
MATFGTFTAGQVLTAAELNALGTWTAFTPSWTNLTVGNGTQSAFYSVINKILFVRVRFTLGSTSAVGTNTQLLLPNSYVADNNSQVAVGTSLAEDTGSASFFGFNYLISSTGIRPIVGRSDGTFLLGNFFTATVPHTWANTDRFTMEFGVQLA